MGKRSNVLNRLQSQFENVLINQQTIAVDRTASESKTYIYDINRDTSIEIGGNASENYQIQADLNGSVLDEMKFITKTGSATADKAKIGFYPDETKVVTIKDDGLDIESGKIYKIADTSVLSSTTLGNGVINSSLQNLGTLTSDVSVLKPTINSNRYFRGGSDTNNHWQLQYITNTGDTNLDYVLFRSITSDATANKGLHSFEIGSIVTMTSLIFK